MISIAEAISDLLFVRDTVVVPGLGAFVRKSISATVNPVANYFAMPSSRIEFDANLREDNDLVVNYMAEKNEIPEDEAKRLLVMFVSDCFNSLKEGKKLVLKDIGTLYYDWADDLVFDPANSVNYNPDAFGLSDFTPQPVIQSKTKAEIKEEIEQQQWDKNTPVTVDEKAVHEEDEDYERHYGWLWILLGLLLLAGIGFGLHYFKVIDFRQWFERKEKTVEQMPWKVTLPSEVKTWNTKEVVPIEKDTLTDSPVEVVQEPEPVEMVKESEPTVAQVQEPVKPEVNIRIIAGCFAQEENAERLANTLRDKGYQYAFIEKRGSKWFVAYGRYASDEEANAALREIREKRNDKAWILK